MKKILGLDLGTNSIGWALVEPENKKILGMGSRIIPMGAELSKFEQGQAQTKNANRRIARGTRRLNKRYKQRRNKLIYVLQELGMLPEQLKLSEAFDNPLKIDRICILPIDKRQKQYSALDLLILRVKALREEISLKELGRIIYLFNQLRGYAGGSMEPEKEDVSEEENDNEEKRGNESFMVFAKVLEVTAPEIITYKGRELKKVKAKVETENGVLDGETFLDILKVNESIELQVNIRKSKQGETITFKLPAKTSWRKKMENLEKQFSELSEEKGREVYLCEYFIDILKENRWVKIRNNVILRCRYQAEFDAIWREQSKYHSILNNPGEGKLSEILQFIFPGTKDTQKNYRHMGFEKGLSYVIRNQIIYYQRELKDQSQLISDCRFERGEKVIPKSHPIFQEYKIWEQINKLTINTKTEKGLNKKGEMKYAYEDKPIPAALKEWLYDELHQKKEVGFGPILNTLKKKYGLRDGIDFLNGMNSKSKLRGNETKLLLQKALGEILWQQLNAENTAIQTKLWDILYNGKGNEYDLESDRTSKILNVIKNNGNKIAEQEQMAIKISKIKFSRNYAALSQKAIENILPLVRAGKYFDSNLSEVIKEKIIRLLNENVSDPFEKAAQEFLDKNIGTLTEGGIINAYATILIYDKHTAKEYGTKDQISHYNQIRRLQQGELRNPLVEQLINETLIIVKDIWRNFGYRPDEIRLELARDLKNNKERRARIYSANRDNQKANDDIKNLLIEIKQELTMANIEKYKLWLSQENQQEEFVKEYKDPSKSEIEKMKLWKEQGHVSTYTGQPIALSELFNRERYDIDHIIPQSRYFDDSFTNKVICEKSVNTDKGNKTAMEYFEIGSVVPFVFSKSDYIDHVNKYFYGLKRSNLLSTKVPEDPIARQMKETQYISVRVKEELNKIVGNENVKTTTGGITDYLRNQWGLTDKFKELLKERYENVQSKVADAEYEKYFDNITKKQKEVENNAISFTDVIMDKEHFTELFNNHYIYKKNNKLIIKGWSKRIDHRHHAIDALVIACTEPKHIKRLNDLNKELQTWLDKNRKEILPDFEGSPTELLEEILNLDANEQKKIFIQIERFRNIAMPWKGFPEDTQQKIEEIIVSQKPKDKLLIQKGNDGKMQIKIRGQLHEGTLYGKSQHKEAYRIPLSKLANKAFATEKTIGKIANNFLKESIICHYKDYKCKNEEAFSAEGILNLNKKLASRNNLQGKPAPHTPISTIKIFYKDPGKAKKKKGQDEPEESLQRLDRSKAYNTSLYVKTGDNYLFAVMERAGKRIFDLITFFDATNLLKETFNKVENKQDFDKELLFKSYFEERNQAKLLFTLKQGDSVYMPDENEDIINDPVSPLYSDYWEDKVERAKRIHYVTKYSGKRIYFIKHNIADTILRGREFGSQDAYEKVGDLSIKENCIKLNIDRLGNIHPYKNDGFNSSPVNDSTPAISEPDIAYRNSIKAFNSLQEMNEADAREMAKLSPEEHLQNANLHIKKVFEKGLEKPMKKNVKFR